MQHFKNRSEPLSISYRFNVPTLPSDHWTKIHEVGGGRIVGEAVHAIDLVSYITGSLPQSISSTSVINKETNKANEDQVALTIIFGDGSGAAIISSTEENRGILSTHLHTDGRYLKELWVEAPASNAGNPRINKKDLELGKQYLKMNGKEFRLLVLAIKN